MELPCMEVKPNIKECFGRKKWKTPSRIGQRWVDRVNDNQSKFFSKQIFSKIGELGSQLYYHHSQPTVNLFTESMLKPFAVTVNAQSAYIPICWEINWFYQFLNMYQFAVKWVNGKIL